MLGLWFGLIKGLGQLVFIWPCVLEREGDLSGLVAACSEGGGGDLVGELGRIADLDSLDALWMFGGVLFYGFVLYSPG